LSAATPTPSPVAYSTSPSWPNPIVVPSPLKYGGRIPSPPQPVSIGRAPIDAPVRRCDGDPTPKIGREPITGAVGNAMPGTPKRPLALLTARVAPRLRKSRVNKVSYCKD